MKIWLIKEGEGLPGNGNVRLMRTGMLAKYLSDHNHQVTWWASTYIHGKKKYLCEEETEYWVNENEKIVLLHSNKVYKKNISISRIFYNCTLAKRFEVVSKTKEVPDVIVVCWPIPNLAKKAVEYGKKNHVPVIVDVRDLWPDIFVRAFPKALEKVASLLLLPMKKSAKKVLRKADGITAVTPFALQWACNKAEREPGLYDKCIFIANEKNEPDEQAYRNSLEKWEQLGITSTTWNMCLFSSLRIKGMDLETVIRAVKKLEPRYPQIRFVIGGLGDGEKYYKELAGDSANIVFAGWLNEIEMDSLMSISKCGIYCLENTVDFRDTFSNKAIQYLAGGLPILTSLTGFAKHYIEKEQMGFAYEEGNAEDCASKIEALLLNETDRIQMSQHASEQFECNFRADKVNSIFEEYIKSIVERY